MDANQDINSESEKNDDIADDQDKKSDSGIDSSKIQERSDGSFKTLLNNSKTYGTGQVAKQVPSTDAKEEATEGDQKVEHFQEDVSLKKRYNGEDAVIKELSNGSSEEMYEECQKDLTSDTKKVSEVKRLDEDNSVSLVDDETMAESEIDKFEEKLYLDPEQVVREHATEKQRAYWLEPANETPDRLIRQCKKVELQQDDSLRQFKKVLELAVRINSELAKSVDLSKLSPIQSSSPVIITTSNAQERCLKHSKPITNTNISIIHEPLKRYRKSELVAASLEEFIIALRIPVILPIKGNASFHTQISAPASATTTDNNSQKRIRLTRKSDDIIKSL